MQKAFLIHGAYGNPGENWFPYLKAELEKSGFQVAIPAFPTPENQTLENWLKAFSKYESSLDGNTILIGHSIGCAFILNLLERSNSKVKAAYLVSGFASQLNLPEFDPLNKTFVERKFKWKKIRENCPEFHIFHSDNDPYVPLEKAETLAKNLHSKVILIKGAGHINAKAGYTKFPQLLEEIKRE